MVAHCESNDGVRFFRLDRMEDVQPLEVRFQPSLSRRWTPSCGTADAFQSDEAEKLTIRYSPRIARWIAEREGKTLAADGSLTLEHQLADTDWAVRHVLQYGPDAEVIEPASVRQAVVARLRQIRSG